LTFFNQ